MAEYRFFRDVAHESVVVCFVFFRKCSSARFLPIFKSQLKHLSFQAGISSTAVQCLAGKYRDYKNHHECEGRMEKSVPRIAVACRVMTNDDPEGHIFLSYPHTKNGLFFLLTTFFIYLFFK